jgi:voltage-gated potassium channel Kch
MASSKAQVSVQPLWLRLLLPTLAIFGIIAFARYLSRPIFRYVASSKIPELLTALSLFIVVGISYLMTAVGLSMALGAFLAGVVLADSEYRHELEANIMPFKGLLLGLFFLAVGMSINTQILYERPLMMASIVVGMVLIKFLVIYAISRPFKLTSRESVLNGILLSQGGEFAFVLFNQASQGQLLDATQTALAGGAITLSMLTTPLLLGLHDLLFKPESETKPPADTIESEGHPVIIAGFGRMGQIIARLLNTLKIGSTVIDHSPSHIDYVRKFGQKAYYGDATQMAILEAGGIARAKLLVVAIDDPESVSRLVKEVRRHYPNLPLIVRARDRSHAYELLDSGITQIERESFAGALAMGQEALKTLGIAPYHAHRLVQRFKKYDLELLEQNYQFHKDEKQIISRAREARAQLEKLFEQDHVTLKSQSNEGWNT